MKRFLSSLVLLVLLSVQAQTATLDKAVCSTADKAGGACDLTTLLGSTNQELSKLYDGTILVVGSLSGTNDIAGSTSPIATSLTDGMMRQFTAAATNTTVMRYNDNGLGLISVKSSAGNALGAGDVVAGTTYIMRYYFANNEWRILTNLGAGAASANQPYVTIGAVASLTAERALTAGTALGLTDGGANSTATIALTDAELTCLAALTSASDKIAYYTGSGTCALADLSVYARTLIDDADATTARATLGLVIGTNVQAYDADLAALAANSTTGFWAYTGAGTGAARTLTAPAAGLTITNPAGTAGNPTFVLANDLAAYEGLAANGIVARTATDTAAARTITGTSNEVTLTNGDGVSGNPTVSLPTALTFTGKTVTGGTFSGPAITTPGAGMTFAGSTSGTTTVAATAIAGTTALTLPAATDTLVGKATTDVLTNKSISLGTNTVTATSAQLITAVSDEQGSGSLVFSTSPTLTTPNIGVATATSVNKVTITAPATSATLTVPDGVTFTGPASSGTAMTLGNAETVTGVKTFGAAGNVGKLKVAGTTSGSTTIDATAVAGTTTLTLPAATDTLVGKATTDIFTNKSISLGTNTVTATSAQMITAISDETGSGLAVFATSPVLTTPNLGTPSAATLTNATGLPISTGVSGLGTGVATALATPSSANLATAITDETGSGLAVFATSPVLTTPNLGTPSAATLTNATGLPISTGVSGLSTGMATFLGTSSSANLATTVTDEVGSGALVFASSPTLTTPNLGTPSAVTLTNATGLPISTGVTGLGTNVATVLATPSSANLIAALTDETGTGAAVFGTSPTFTTNVTLGSDTVSDFTGLGMALATGALGLDDTGATDEFCLTYEATGPTTQWQACGGGGGGGTPGGSSGQIQWNNAGSFDGFTMSGDATIDTTTGAVTIAANAVALGSDTTGSYAAGDAEAGAALTGDSATSFFSSGTLEAARLPAASETAQGACELATTTEAETGTDTTRCVTSAGVAAAIAANSTGLVYIGQVAGTTTDVDLALGGTYSKIVLVGSVFRSTAGNATVAVSDDGTTFGTAVLLNATGSQFSMSLGSVEISGTGLAATNKTITPSMVAAHDVDGSTGSSSPFSSGGTETSETGVTTHLRFDSSNGSVAYQWTVYGVP